MVGRVSGTELQDVAVTRWREANFVVGEPGATTTPPIEPSEADSLEASTREKYNFNIQLHYLPFTSITTKNFGNQKLTLSR